MRKIVQTVYNLAVKELKYKTIFVQTINVLVSSLRSIWLPMLWIKDITNKVLVSFLRSNLPMGLWFLD